LTAEEDAVIRVIADTAPTSSMLVDYLSNCVMVARRKLTAAENVKDWLHKGDGQLPASCQLVPTLRV